MTCIKGAAVLTEEQLGDIVNRDNVGWSEVYLLVKEVRELQSIIFDNSRFAPEALPKPTPAEKAVEYFLTQLIYDSSVAWYCGSGTEVFKLMMEAAVARRGLTGKAAQEYEAAFTAAMKPVSPIAWACGLCDRVEPWPAEVVEP